MVSNCLGRIVMLIIIGFAVAGLATCSSDQSEKNESALDAPTPTVTPEPTPTSSPRPAPTSPVSPAKNPVTNRWKSGVTYIYHSSGGCTEDNSLDPQKCVDPAEAKALCKATKGMSRNLPSLVVSNYGSPNDYQLLSNNGASMEFAYWDDKECRLSLSVSGMSKGTYLNRSWTGNVRQFIYSDGEVLAHTGLDFFLDRP